MDTCSGCLTKLTADEWVRIPNLQGTISQYIIFNFLQIQIWGGMRRGGGDYKLK